MKRNTTTVTLTGDKRYVRALRMIAARHGIHIGDVTRAALDEKWGDELRAYMAVFRAESDQSEEQTSDGMIAESVYPQAEPAGD